MERLKPIDLDRAQLRRAMRGYDRSQVDELLKRAAKEIETLLAEVKAVTEESERARADVERFRAQEQTLKDAIVLAQKAADDTRAAAYREAELINQEAQRASAELQAQTQQRINDLRWEIERLHGEKQRFLKSFKALLQEHLRELDPSEGKQPSLMNVESGDPPSTAAEAG